MSGAQGQECEASVTERVESSTVGDFRVEDQQFGDNACGGVPVVSKSEYLVCLFGFGDSGIGVDQV